MEQKHRSGRFFLLSVSSEGVGRARYSFLTFFFLAFALMMLSLANPQGAARLRSFASDLAMPVISAASLPFVALADALDGLTNFRSLRVENMRLAAENMRLKEWYEKALYLEAENQSLRDFLNLKKDSEMAYITTRIVSDTGGAFVRSFLVPAGSADGVRTGQAVLSGRGLVGRVTEVGKSSARVLLITDLNARIPVIIQDTHQRGILTGNNTERLVLERLPPGSSVTSGARVMTSGDGGLIPAGLPVGIISKVEGGTVELKPLADLDRLSFVQIVQSPVDPALVTGEINPPVMPAKSKKK